MTANHRTRSSFSHVALAAAALLLVALAGCGRHDSGAAATSAARAAAPEPAVPSPVYRADPATAAENVLTYHNGPARTGLNPHETILTPANVSSASFGKLFSDPVDGAVYAQPLYLAGVSIPGKGRTDVVYVATENDSVYAFDADRPGPPLWRASLLEGGSAVTSSVAGCDQIVPQIGITSTPVIDPATGTLYAEAMTRRGQSGPARYAQQLHALDIATGAEKFGGPVTIAGSAPGNGAGGLVAFSAFEHLNRPGLALSHGVLYIAFGSHCDQGDYHGWLFAYDAAPLRLRAVFNTTPNGSEGAIWQTGDAPAVDASGNVYVLTGNGTFDANAGGADYGDSFLKLALAGNAFRVLDFFTPYNQQRLNSEDLDVGSGGIVLLPDQRGPHRQLAVGGGKNAVLYVVDRNAMGHFQAHGNRQIVQQIRQSFSPIFSTPASWNGYVYLGRVGRPIEAFTLTGGRLSAAPVSHSPDSFQYPGTTPSVSSDGDHNAIVWALDTSGNVSGTPAILRAYDATNLARELYASAPSGSDGVGVKFTTPTIAHGRVYFGAQNSLEVYGLRQ
jgi:outer membrane protein assembly factor BamB